MKTENKAREMDRGAGRIVPAACLMGAVLFGTPFVRAQSRTAKGPPAPVPYRHVPDPADDAERRIVVKGADRGLVWLLTGLLNEGNDGSKEYLDMLARLKLRHWRQGTWPFWYPVSITRAGRKGRKTWGDFRDSPKAFGQLLETMLRLRERGMTLQLLPACNGPFYADRRIESHELEEWRDYVYTAVKYCRLMGTPVDYWEVWNEPRAGPYKAKPGEFTWEEYLAAWDAAYDAIRRANPGAKIVGPSYSRGEDPNRGERLEPFLDHCREKGQKLDILSFHFPSVKDHPKGIWLEPAAGHEKIERIRKMVEKDYQSLGVEEIHIDEWGLPRPDMGPGTAMAIFHYLDLAGVHRAAPGIWSQGALSGLLVKGTRTPSTQYWCWTEYAGQDGGLRLVTETNDRGVVALASRHDDSGIVRALLARAKRRRTFSDRGNKLPPVRTTVDFEGLPVDGRAEVSLMELGPYDGPMLEEDLESLTTRKVMTVVDGRLSLVLDAVREQQVVSIRIAPPGTSERQKAAAARSAPKRSAGTDKRMDRKERDRVLAGKWEEAARGGHIRIACGAKGAWTDPAGNRWCADRAFWGDRSPAGRTPSLGQYGHLGASGMLHRGPIAIEATENPELYRTELWGLEVYRLALPSGKYLLRLHFAETYGLEPGGRAFDVVVEGKTVLKEFDAAREAGGIRKACVRDIEFELSDGVLDIGFVHKKGHLPMVNGIEVMRESHKRQHCGERQARRRHAG